LRKGYPSVFDDDRMSTRRGLGGEQRPQDKLAIFWWLCKTSSCHRFSCLLNLGSCFFFFFYLFIYSSSTQIFALFLHLSLAPKNASGGSSITITKPVFFSFLLATIARLDARRGCQEASLMIYVISFSREWVADSNLIRSYRRDYRKGHEELGCDVFE
jgi:hypothetical protein